MKKENKAIWKDTNKYPFYIQYEYPLSIRNRALFFWAITPKGWRAIINLAGRLTEPNRICIVYLFGEEKEQTVTNHIKKLNNPKVIVLWISSISKDEILKSMDGAETIKLITKKWGIGQGNQEFDERNPYEGNLIENELSEMYQEQTRKIKEGRQTTNSIQSYIKHNGYVWMEDTKIKIGGDTTNHIYDLLKIIKKIYPLGVESDNPSEYGYKMLHFSKWFSKGLNGSFDSINKLGVNYVNFDAPVQLSLFDTTSWGIVEFVRAFVKECEKQILKNGFFELEKIIRTMEESPFGFYECNYYGLCLGIALKKYKEGYYISTALNTIQVENFDFSDYFKNFYRLRGTRRLRPVYIYTQSDNQIRLAKKLLEIFPPKWKVKVVCLENVLTVCRSWITDNVLYDSIERTSKELFEILNLSEPCVCSNATEKYADWLTDDMVENLKKEIREIDNNFLKFLVDKYGETRARLYKKSQVVKGGAVGWLHSVKMVDERVENYMKETVCRECGAVIHNHGYYVQKEKRAKSKKLTKQNIINLNKKYFGRYQNEFLCLHCLCEALGIEEWDLYESMVRFKEQGCELFL